MSQFLYQPRRITAVYTGQLAGLEVITRALTVDELLQVVHQGDALAMMNAAADDVEALFDTFIQCAYSWNLVDEQGPIPLTREGLGGLDQGIVQLLLRGWMRAVAGVPDPLDDDSDAGQRAPVESLPMDPP